MADNDAFGDVVNRVAGSRASGLKASNNAVSLMLDVSGLGADEREAIEQELRAALAEAGAQSVRVMMTAERIAPRLIAVASGKGGVGKSTLSANVAVAMAKAGRAV
ncbi:MAG TPA: P-loop NTPase, partial [Sphingorhabdus sp.]|nr:P-loop NTPase [Sphingorhabdus sp.]